MSAVPAGGPAAGAPEPSPGPSPPAALSATPLATEVERAARLAVTGPVEDAAGFQLQRGHLTIRFTGGRRARVKDEQGLVGVVVSGRGQVLFEEQDPVARAIFSWNFQRATSRSLDRGRMDDPIKRAVVLWPGGLPGGVAGTKETAAASSVLEDLAGVLTKTLDAWKSTRDWDFPIRRTLASEAGAAAGSGAGEEIAAYVEGREEFGWKRTAPGDERLVVLKQADLPRSMPLRVGSGDGASSGWRLARLEMDLRAGEAPALGIRARLRLEPGGGQPIAAFALSEAREIRQAESIEFVDLDTGFGADVVSRAVAPGIRVRRVEDAHGAPLDFVHAHGRLLVRMPGGAGPSDSAAGASAPSAAATVPAAASEIVVHLDTDLARRPADHEYFTLRGPGWFPIPEGQEGRFLLAWSIRSPDPLRPLTGFGGEPHREGDGAWFIEQSFPLQVRQPVLACGKYVETGALAGRTPVRVWSYARANPQGDSIARFSAAAVTFFEGAFGAFPFPVLDIVETAPLTGGQAGPGLLLMEGRDPAELARERRVIGALEFNMTFAHEIAHQWWGQSVSWKSGRDVWLFEALAEYSGWLFVRTLKGNLGDLAERRWLARARSAASVTSIAASDGLTDDPVSRRQRADLIYCKGALLLRRLARETGESAFHEALGAFARAKAGRDVDAADFIDFMSRSTGRPLRPIFDEWVHGVGMPR